MNAHATPSSARDDPGLLLLFVGWLALEAAVSLAATQLILPPGLDGEAIYGLRKAIVEPVYGQIKSSRGLDRFRRHGLEIVNGGMEPDGHQPQHPLAAGFSKGVAVQGSDGHGLMGIPRRGCQNPGQSRRGQHELAQGNVQQNPG